MHPSIYDALSSHTSLHAGFCAFITLHFWHERYLTLDITDLSPLPCRSQPPTYLPLSFSWVFLPCLLCILDETTKLRFFPSISHPAIMHVITQSLILLFFSFCHKPAIIDPATRHRSEYAPYRNHSFVSYSTFFCSGLSCRHSLLHLSLDLICTYWKQYEPKNSKF